MPSAGRPHRLQLPREHYIPISVPRLAKACAKYLPTRLHKQWHKFCAILQAIYHYRLIASTLKTDYMLFSPTSGKKERERKKRKPEDIQRAEDRFLDSVTNTMDKANYKVLGKQEWDMALAENYSMDLPIDIRWELHDSEMLTRYLKQRPEYDSGSSFTKRILVFYRGIGRTQASGLFISQKIEMLVNYAIWQPLHALLTGRRVEKSASHSTSHSTSQSTSARAADTRSGDLDTAGDGSTFAERQTLQEQLPNATEVINKFGTTLTVKEPTFKSMVALYRDAPTKAGADPSIWIKSFRHVPMADVELVFPHKKIYIETIELVKFWVIVVVAVVLAARKLFEARSGDGGFAGVGLMLLIALGSKAVQTYSTMSRTLQHNKDLMTKLLYEKSLDTGEGQCDAYV
jgi:hypothetical protein